MPIGQPEPLFQHFFTHDRHLILSSAPPNEDPKLDRLLNRLLLDFSDRRDHIRGFNGQPTDQAVMIT